MRSLFENIKNEIARSLFDDLIRSLTKSDLPLRLLFMSLFQEKRPHEVFFVVSFYSFFSFKKNVTCIAMIPTKQMTIHVEEQGRLAKGWSYSSQIQSRNKDNA